MIEITDELVEKLADFEHQQWTHWTRYMLANFTFDNLHRWENQCNMMYRDLSEKEKESDRYWARQALELLNKEHQNDNLSGT